MMKEFWCRKITIFMHDPFEKTYVMITKQEGGHEGAAKTHLKDVLKTLGCDNKLETLFSEVKGYDVLSATLDRWVMVNKQVTPSAFVNPFDPDIIYIMNFKINDEKLKSFYGKLNTIFDELKNSLKGEELAKATYHVLYGLAEPLWYEDVGVVQVADTRSPTHTIFDHLSSAVGISNIYDAKEKNFKGYVVEVDLPGIQSFIAGGRGPGDLWIRSWLISAFVWYMIKELVWELGADIMLSPTARYNPFYYSLLREKLLGKSKILDDILNSLPYPDQPVMPGTVTLLLPELEVLKKVKEISELYNQRCSGKNDNECLETVLSKYFEKKLREAWSYIVNIAEGEEDEHVITALWKSLAITNNENMCLTVKNGVAEIMENCESILPDEVSEVVSKALKTIREDPPLIPKVTVVSVEKAFEKFNEKFLKFKEKNKTQIDRLFHEVKEKNKDALPYNKNENEFWNDLGEKLFFHWLMTNEYISEIRKNKTISVSTKAKERWTCERTAKAYKEGIRDVKMCSCGRPAVIHNNTDEFVPPLRSREALCPYCLVMRLAQYKQKTYEKFVGRYDARKVIAPRLHVLTLAGLPELSKYLVEKGKVLPKTDYKELARVLRTNTLPQKTKEETRSMKSLDLERSIDKFKDKEKVSAVRVYLSDDKGQDYVITLESDDLSFIERRMNKYLAMVKADADGMGDLKSGRLGSSPDVYFNKLLKNIVDEKDDEIIDNLSKLIKTIIHKFYEEFYPEQAVLETDGHDVGASEVSSTDNLPSTLVTPSYAYQLSYAIMIEALRDKDIVLNNYGVVVYAGGDDLLALVPARSLYGGECMEPLDTKHLSGEIISLIKENYCSPALWVWWLTRLNHWGLTEYPHGFFKGDHYFAPAPIAYGRKYGVAIRHYRDPLSVVFEEADNLESKAKKLKKTIDNANVLEKDGVVVSYGRVGTVEGGTLPNTLLVQRKQELPLGLGRRVAELVKMVVDKNGCLSRNYIHDLDLQLAELCEHALSNLKGMNEERVNEFLKATEATWMLVTQRNAVNKKCKAIGIIKEIFEKLKSDKVRIKFNDKELDVEKSKIVLTCELAKFLREWVKAAR